MAKKQSMTFEEALQVILSSEGDNPLRAMLELAAQGAFEQLGGSGAITEE